MARVHHQHGSLEPSRACLQHPVQDEYVRISGGVPKGTVSVPSNPDANPIAAQTAGAHEGVVAHELHGFVAAAAERSDLPGAVSMGDQGDAGSGACEGSCVGDGDEGFASAAQNSASDAHDGDVGRELDGSRQEGRAEGGVRSRDGGCDGRRNESSAFEASSEPTGEAHA
jgi:hypothetical protein